VYEEIMMIVLIQRKEIVEITENRHIIINGVTGAIDIISTAIKEKLLLFQKTGDLNVFDRDLVKYLIQRGYLLDSADREDQLLDEIISIQENSPKTPMLDFLVIPSYSCNLRCVYCYEGEVKKKKTKLDEVKINKMMEYFDSIITSTQQKSNIFRLNFYGGEPFLPVNIPVILDIMKKMKDRYPGKKIEFGAITNGTTIRKFIRKLRKNGLVHVQITLDGDKNIHDQRRPNANGKGSYEDIIEGISKCLENGIRVGLRINVDLQNIKTLPDLAAIINEKWNEALDKGQLEPYLGIIFEPSCSGYQSAVKHTNEIINGLIDLTTSNPEMFKTISLKTLPFFQFLKHSLYGGRLIQPKIYNCTAIQKAGIFDPEGYIYTCWGVVGKKDHAVGTYFPEIQIWDEQLDYWRSRNVKNMKKCYNCPCALICAGGCANNSLNRCNDILEPYCQSIGSLNKVIELLLRIQGIKEGNDPIYGKYKPEITRIVEDKDLWVKIRVTGEKELFQEFAVLPEPLIKDEEEIAITLDSNEFLQLNPSLSLVEKKNSFFVTGFVNAGFVNLELNETAIAIIEEFQTKKQFSDALRDLAEKYNVSEPVIRKEVMNSVERFIQAEVLLRS
ncbi:MAG: PqqD family peptide modification chaperone, partial [Candidatus Hodarchaeales archaeon]